MAIDRRRSKRFVVVDLDLCDRKTEQSIGRVVNISDGGLFAIAEISFPVGDIRPFYIPINTQADEMEIFPFTAWVIWSHPNSLHPSKFSLGLEFVDQLDLQNLLDRIDVQ